MVTEPGTDDRLPIRFRDTDVEALHLGPTPLRDYLDGVGQSWVLRLREQLEHIDVSLLVASYEPEGRHALHPRRMLGLIIYGMLMRHWSLRELEALARRDLGAVWICGGAQPDHSAIGQFFLRHVETLTEEFFVSVTRQLVTALHLSPTMAADDGTVVEAAASRFRTLRLQAAEAARVQAAEAVAAHPQDPKAAEALTQAAVAAETARERTEARHEKDPKAPEASVVPHEPEAVVQPRKDGAIRPAYKPSIKVHPSRLIVGQYVDPCSETTAVAPLLVQHEQVFDALPTTQLSDAGYHSIEVIGLFVELEIDLLCPGGKARGVTSQDWDKAAAPTHFTKADFRYDDEANVYHCPVGNLLRPQGSPQRDRHGQTFQLYKAKDCAECVKRSRCTDAKTGRQVRRYEGEELKEGMKQVLSQPGARRQYRHRQGMVEPVFSELRGQQGLTRFHRRGLAKVRAEFGLHCVAYNLRRAVRLQARACRLQISLQTSWGRQNILVFVVIVWAEPSTA